MKGLLTRVVVAACVAATATCVDAKPRAKAKAAPERTVLAAFNYGERAALLYEIPISVTYHDLGGDESSTVLAGGRVEFLCETSPDKGSLKDAAVTWFGAFDSLGTLTTAASPTSVSGHGGAYFTSIGSFAFDGAKARPEVVKMKALAIHGAQDFAVVCGAVISLKASKAQRAALDRVFKSFVLKSPYPAP